MKNVHPLILNSPDDSGHRLKRIEAAANDTKSEWWLQEILHRHPEILPVDEFDDTFGELIPIGREIDTGRGVIDNLYVSPTGHLTIVETKLWKNPEKHRAVVGQIFGYAMAMVKWDYDHLCEAVLNCSRSRGETSALTLEDKVAPFLKKKDLDVADFQAGVSDSLAKGHFLLLIVGDKISPNAVMLSEAIQSAPGLQFTLGLVELKLYPMNEGSDWPLLVVPDVVGRTVETIRGVVKVTYNQEKPKVVITNEEFGGEEEAQALDLEQFLKAVPTDLVTPYQEAMKKWEEIGGTLLFTNKFLWWKHAFAGRTLTPVRCGPDRVSVIGRSAFERWFSGDFAWAYEEYLRDLEKSPVALNYARNDKMFIKHGKINAGDLLRNPLRGDQAG